MTGNNGFKSSGYCARSTLAQANVCSISNASGISCVCKHSANWPMVMILGSEYCNPCDTISSRNSCLKRCTPREDGNTQIAPLKSQLPSTANLSRRKPAARGSKGESQPKKTVSQEVEKSFTRCYYPHMIAKGPLLPKLIPSPCDRNTAQNHRPKPHSSCKTEALNSPGPAKEYISNHFNENHIRDASLNCTPNMTASACLLTPPVDR